LPEEAGLKGTWTRMKSQAAIAFFPESQASLAFSQYHALLNCVQNHLAYVVLQT
jgi:hypothetical protein